MAFVHGKDTFVLVDERDLSTFFNAVDLGRSVETAETTTFQKGSKAYIPGMRDGTISLQGLYDGVADAVDDALNGLTADALMTVAIEGFGVGNRTDSVKAHKTSYGKSSPIGGAVTVSAEAQANGGLDTGVSLHPFSAVTATGNDSSVDNAASSSDGGVAYLHVTAASGTSQTLDVKVQHSTDNTTWVDLITFTQATAATSERITATGTVNRYVRATYTIGGTGPSFTFAVTFARN